MEGVPGDLLYLIQVQLAAQHNAWSEEETVMHLVLAVEEEPLQGLLSLAYGEQQSLMTLVEAPEQQEGRTSELAELGLRDSEIIHNGPLHLQMEGLPAIPSPTEEDLALNAFVKALTQGRSRTCATKALIVRRDS